jgi:hypothetical protein
MVAFCQIRLVGTSKITTWGLSFGKTLNCYKNLDHLTPSMTP